MLVISSSLFSLDKLLSIKNYRHNISFVVYCMNLVKEPHTTCQFSERMPEDKLLLCSRNGSFFKFQTMMVLALFPVFGVWESCNLWISTPGKCFAFDLLVVNGGTGFLANAALLIVFDFSERFWSWTARDQSLGPDSFLVGVVKAL